MNTLSTTQDIDFSNRILDFIDTSDRADATKMHYKKQIARAIDAQINFTDFNSLVDYANSLTPSNRNLFKSALNLVFSEYEKQQNLKASSENVLSLIALSKRIKALTDSIHTTKSQGKSHTWLKASEVSLLLIKPNHYPYGRRDFIALSILFGAGLRRTEAINLKFSDVIQKTDKQGNDRWVLSVVGKGAKHREIPISSILYDAINKWGERLNHEGYVLRGLNKRKELTESLSSTGLFNIVQRYGRMIGKELAPHDCRRTFAMLGYAAGIPIKQISILLGHSSVTVTERYLNVQLDLDNTICDYVPIPEYDRV